MNILDKPVFLNAVWMKIVNKLLQNICAECHIHLLTFPWEKTKFKMLLLSLSSSTHTSASFFFTVTKGFTSFHSFIKTDLALWSGVWILWTLNRTRDMTCTILVFFLNSTWKMLIKLFMFMYHCICHSILFRTVFMCIDGYCNGGTVSFKWVTVCGWSEARVSQDSIPAWCTVRLTALRMTVTLKALTAAL